MPALTVAAFAFGTLIGSFLNVCIFRLPENRSVVFPASHCRACGKPVRWYDNVPCVSYFALGGRCRDCKARLSPQYVIVEALSGVLFAAFYQSFGFSAKGVVYLALSLALLVQGVIDFRHQIIPDAITLPGLGIGLAVSAFFPEIHGQTVWTAALWKSFLGLIAGGGFLYLAGTIAEWVLKKEAMGGGDVKLLAMIGSVIGWHGVLWTVFVSSFLGAAVGIYLRLRHGRELIPYGPYLGAAAFSYLWVGPAVIGWYTRCLGWT